MRMVLVLPPLFLLAVPSTPITLDLLLDDSASSRLDKYATGALKLLGRDDRPEGPETTTSSASIDGCT